MAFRALFNVLALKTNWSGFLLAPDEEEALGEAWGDVAVELGLVDNTVTKAIFAGGVLVAVGGTKAIGFAAYETARRNAAGVLPPQGRPADRSAAAGAGPQPAPAPAKDNVTGSSQIPQATPGAI